MTELDQLIAEQEAELRRGNFQGRESEVVMSFDTQVAAYGDGASTIADLFNQDGENSQPYRLKSKGCIIHGYTFIKVVPSGSWRCQQCNTERMRLRRRLAGVKPRNFCPHEGRYSKVSPSGASSWCTECKREYNNRPEVREKRREYDRRRSKRAKSSR
jgi:hypothetical protein